jgi:mannosylglycoprotein endo-beta-mannosidase
MAWTPQGTPDRNTGLFDKVEVESTGALTVRDPFLRTLAITDAMHSNRSATLRYTTRIHNAAPVALMAVLHLELRYDETSSLVFSRTERVTVPRTGQTTVNFSFNISAGDLRLWWPHTHGHPHLYTALTTLWAERALSSAAPPSHTHRMLVGIRTVGSYLDETVQGRVFTVNGRRVFLQGGNWIASDQLLRYTGDDTRYQVILG